MAYTRLTPELKAKAIELRSQGTKREEMARILGLKKGSVDFLLLGQPPLSRELHSKVKSPKQYSVGTTEKILGLRRDGMKVREIAKVLGLDYYKVFGDVYRSDIRLCPPKKVVTPDLTEKVFELRDSGLKRRLIAEKLGVNIANVNRILQAAPHISKKVFVENHTNHGELVALTKRILELRKKNMGRGEIADKLGISMSQVYSAIQRKGEPLSKKERKLAIGKGVELRRGEQAGMAKKSLIGFASAAERYKVCAGGFGGEYLGPEEYTPQRIKVKWRCKKGHEFLKAPVSVIRGQWCHICAKHVSHGENEVLSFTKKFFPDAIGRDRKVLYPKELDIYVPSLKLGIEYHGLHWHGERIARDKFNVFHKCQLAKKKGIRLIVLFEDEWLTQRELVENRLTGVFLGKETPILHPYYNKGIVSDDRWGQDFLYEKAGLVKKKGIRPVRWYFKRGKSFPRVPLFDIKKEFLVKEGAGLLGKEWEIMKARGYDRIWDAGSTVWVSGLASNL
jgi:transcriptional regulator